MKRLPSLGPRGEGWVIIQFLLLALTAVAGIRFGGVVNGISGLVISWIGLALMVAGAVLLARGLMDLGRNLTPVPHPREGAQLVVSGVYARARHPIYGGLIVTAFGWGLASVSLVTLVSAAVLALFFGLKSRREEVWLREHYAGYDAYALRTRRFVPHLF